MTITCSQLDDLLFEGDSASLETAARHAEQCPECMEKLAEWNEISATAQTMHTTWNSDLLWPRIERSLRRERSASRNHWFQIAAALILTIGLGTVAWRAMQGHNRQAAYEQDILSVSALDSVEQAERAHLAAIEKLEQLADPKLEEAATPLMVSYKEKLLVLDEAIDECQTAIDTNRQNAHVRRQLLTIYSEKQRTLQDVLREDTHVSNQ